MKFRRLRPPSSANAARMTVRTHVPLGVKVAIACVGVAAAIAVGVVLARWAPGSRARPDLQASVTRLAEANRKLGAERDHLLEASNTIDSRGLIERSTIKELGNQVAALEAENTRLKEDVAFFEAATADRPPGGAVDAVSGIAVRRFQVTQDRADHTARYRILLTQDARATRPFSGTLQILATFQQDGRTTTVVPVASGGGTAVHDGVNVSPNEVVFRSYKRIDGSFAMPPSAVLKAVQARIFERGLVRVQQTVAVN